MAFRRMEVLRPPLALVGRLCRLTDSLFESVKNFLQQTTKLRTTRDLLLPRFISGEIDVSDLDIKVPEVIAQDAASV